MGWIDSTATFRTPRHVRYRPYGFYGLCFLKTLRYWSKTIISRQKLIAVTAAILGGTGAGTGIGGARSSRADERLKSDEIYRGPLHTSLISLLAHHAKDYQEEHYLGKGMTAETPHATHLRACPPGAELIHFR